MFKQGIIGFNIVLLPAFYFDRHPATLSLVRTLWYPVFYLEKKKKNLPLSLNPPKQGDDLSQRFVKRKNTMDVAQVHTLMKLKSLEKKRSSIH